MSHHIPDTAAAMNACCRKIKPGRTFPGVSLLRLRKPGAAFSNSSIGCRTDTAGCFPFGQIEAGSSATSSLSCCICLCRIMPPVAPVGRSAIGASKIPLQIYEKASFYIIRNDALTGLVRRWSNVSAGKNNGMMTAAGLDRYCYFTPCTLLACHRQEK